MSIPKMGQGSYLWFRTFSCSEGFWKLWTLRLIPGSELGMWTSDALASAGFSLQASTNLYRSYGFWLRDDPTNPTGAHVRSRALHACKVTTLLTTHPYKCQLEANLYILGVLLCT